MTDQGGNPIVIKFRFILFIMTAHIGQGQQKRKKWKKVKGRREIKEKTSKILKNKYINPKCYDNFFSSGFLNGQSILHLTFLPSRKNHGTFRINFCIEVVCFCDKHPKSLEENRFLKISFFHSALVHKQCSCT